MKPIPAEYDPEIPVVEAIRQRDPDALAELMARQGRWVRGVIYAVTGRADEVDDVAQKVWMKVWRDAGSLQDPQRWRTWLYSIARNAATDTGRSKQRQRRLIGHLADAVRGTSPRVERPDQAASSTETHQVMQAAIEALPAMYREPFVLKHLEGWSYQEIGEALGLPTDTVETRLVRARRLLREQLAGKV